MPKAEDMYRVFAVYLTLHNSPRASLIYQFPATAMIISRFVAFVAFVPARHE